MNVVKVAHIREQGTDIIIVPFGQGFERQFDSTKQRVANEIQVRAQAAGLAGIVALVWHAGAGRMGFLAPPDWHPFFRSLTMLTVVNSLNRTLSW